MKCPYCKKKMEFGTIQSNGPSLLFSVRRHRFLIMARDNDVQLAKGWYTANVPAFHCPTCKKIIIDTY